MINDYAAEIGRGECTLIDVREANEFAAGHLPGAINMPLSELSADSLKLAEVKAPLYLYCKSGARSAAAERIFYQAGFTEAQNIGGILDWTGEITLS